MVLTVGYSYRAFAILLCEAPIEDLKAILGIVQKPDLAQLCSLKNTTIKRGVRMFPASNCRTYDPAVSLHCEGPICPDWATDQDHVGDV